MRIPEELAEWGKKKIEPYPAEGFVYGGGPQNPVLMLVGEAPGETEIHNGIPFSGRAGKELMLFLDRAGLKREDVYITSAVRSRPFKWREKKERSGEIILKKYNRTPNEKEIRAHAPILDWEVEHVNPQIIMTLGNIGLKRLAGKAIKIADVHGELLKQPVQRYNEDGTYSWTKKDFLLFPTYHPASIFYNRKLLETIHRDFDRLADHIREIKHL
ncbi:uracil-DNA glycosylase [Jeotgalibacillus campisalis]|uniref:Uracil-DNA glycosylase n=1 Tax=Jeotgalibacillus campisalis TaxID=220754 RepID=A0A0C2RG45_9BACL|nr:uracil-DNA glycosylase [Jeotgalibacillus campisalis]KIL49160.1 uracil-DNA glycosylase [Jeotgalibacillus campisalis]